MSPPVIATPQFSGSVATQIPNGVYLSGGNLEDPTQRAMGILGTPMKVGPSTFPTVPASFNANQHYYPGLAHSYLGAALVETPSHGQIRYATYDIPSIQLTIHKAVSSSIIQQWQLMLTAPATLPGG